MHVLRGLASPVRKVWVSPDSTRVAALSDSRRLAVWDVPRDRLLFIFEASVGGLADEAGGCFGPRSDQFALASGSEARLYDLEQGCTVRRWLLSPGSPNRMETDARGRWLLLRREPVEKRAVWRLRELASAERPVLLHEQTETNWSAYNMALAPEGDRFLVWDAPTQAGRTNVLITAYAVSDGRALWHEITRSRDPELRVAFDRRGRFFGYTQDASAQLCLRRWSDFAEIGRTPDSTGGMYDAISPSGQEFAGNGWFFPDLTGMKHGIRIATGRTPLAWVSAFSPDARLLAQGTEEGIVLVLDIPEVRRRLAAAGIIAPRSQ
jgi:hypothetical protein